MINPFNIFRKKPSISFCITCRNRMWQIRETLPQNLHDNRDEQDMVEFVLVDFGSTDGLREWVGENFEEELRSGYLKYYYSDEMPQWHMSVAKNTVHRLGANEILVNLDADNFTGPHGGDWVSRKIRLHGLRKTLLHQWSGTWQDGTHGRIAIGRDIFMSMGGYDEALEGSAYDDADLLKRARALGIKRIKAPDRKYNRAITNVKGQGDSAVRTHDEWLAINERNREVSRKNIAEGRLVANQAKAMMGVSAVKMFGGKNSIFKKNKYE